MEIVAVIVLATTVWVFIDAGRIMDVLPAETRKAVSPHGAQSPTGWAIGSLLLWIVVFPWYLARRGDYIAALRREIDRTFPNGVPTPADSPGQFKITGVDRATKMDTTWHCSAESEANARVKAELESIVPTRVERVG